MYFSIETNPFVSPHPKKQAQVQSVSLISQFNQPIYEMRKTASTK